ncbi:MAG: hypothetical protein Q7S40_09715 [Opitutaceae bacterium]|nr:hypothetical protein [Opitutaceae bacterium]
MRSQSWEITFLWRSLLHCFRATGAPEHPEFKAQLSGFLACLFAPLGYDLEVSSDTLEFLVREGIYPHLGARPLRQAVERHLRDAVVRELFARGACHGIAELDASARRLIVRTR